MLQASPVKKLLTDLRPYVMGNEDIINKTVKLNDEWTLHFNKVLGSSLIEIKSEKEKIRIEYYKFDGCAVYNLKGRKDTTQSFDVNDIMYILFN